jgi:hypothetical protein
MTVFDVEDIVCCTLQARLCTKTKPHGVLIEKQRITDIE